MESIFSDFSIDLRRFKKLNLELSNKNLNKDNFFMFIEKENYNFGFYYYLNDLLYEIYTVCDHKKMTFNYLHGNETEAKKILKFENFVVRSHSIEGYYSVLDSNNNIQMYNLITDIIKDFINSLKNEKRFRYLFLTEPNLYNIVKEIYKYD